MEDIVQNIKTLSDVDCRGRRVFVRVDFNVPQDDRGNVTDDARILAALPTIQYLVENKAKVILASHLGRPKGERINKYSLQNVATVLAKHLGRPVSFVQDCIGKEVENAVNKMADGSVILLENLRFYKEETNNDSEFAQKLASLAEIYVNDAFGSAHRAHASTEGITHFIDTCVAGFLMERELTFLGEKVANAQRPFVVILGGAKVSDKIQVIDNLLDKSDVMLIGGAMAYTFLSAMGKNVGNSLVEHDKIEIARQALEKASKLGVKFIVPVDHVVTTKLNTDTREIADCNVVDEEIPDGCIGVDIGPKTIELFSKELQHAKTVLWNGPMGIFEISDTAKGTFAIAEAVAKSTALSIIGGGDSSKAIKESGFADKVTFVSTGGGASLEYLEGTSLPGVEALRIKR